MAELCKVLIVDDEYIMQQGITHLINWDKEGFLIVGKANNGEEALLMVEEQKPHIVLVDIVMPVLDGVELTKILHERYPDLQIIVLSGFDKFEYVKETLKSGAMDYLLKPTLTPDEFLKTLKRATENIPGFNFAGDRNLNLNHAIEWFISGYDEKIEIENFPEFAVGDSYRLLGIDVSYIYGNDNDSIGKLRKNIRQLLNEQNIVFARTEIDNKNLIYIMNYDFTREVHIINLISRIASDTKKINKKSFFVLSERFSNIQDARTIYKEVEGELCSGFYYEAQSLLRMTGEVREKNVIPKFDYSNFSHCLQEGNFNEAISKMKDYINICLESKEDYEKIKNKAKNLMYNVLVVMEDFEVEIDGLRKKYFNAIEKTSFASEFSEVIKGILKEIAEEIIPNISKTDRIMDEITKYIWKHYEENLDLDTLAKYFNYNYNYLSTYFNSKYSEGFSGYLNKIRIEKACEMLRKSSLPISDISSKVGYSDHSYFCRVFKKATGYTPSVYRRRFR